MWADTSALRMSPNLRNLLRIFGVDDNAWKSPSEKGAKSLTNSEVSTSWNFVYFATTSHPLTYANTQTHMCFQTPAHRDKTATRNTSPSSFVKHKTDSCALTHEICQMWNTVFFKLTLCDFHILVVEFVGINSPYMHMFCR